MDYNPGDQMDHNLGDRIDPNRDVRTDLKEIQTFVCNVRIEEASEMDIIPAI